MRPPSDIPAPPLPDDWIADEIGSSVAGREIVVLRRPVEAPRRTVLVVSGVHGNEPAGPPIVRSLVEVPLPDDIEVLLVPEMNPDGVAAGTRDNANRVDLNRNFGWEWRANTGGPTPFSEPETQAIVGLIETVRPGLVVWVHQPLGYVGPIGPSTPMSFAEAWSRGSGDRVRTGVTQHGGGESWTAFAAGLPSILIEAESWGATPETVAAHRAGFAELIATLG